MGILHSLLSFIKRVARHTLPAFVCGFALALAFEPVAFAWILPFAVAGFAYLTHKKRLRVALAVGMAFGAGFHFIFLSWISAISNSAWLAAGVTEMVIYGGLGVVFALLSRLRYWPLWLAAAWAAMEVFRTNWPMGGMPMGRLSFAVIDTPAALALPYVGSLGVTLLLALLGTLLAWVVLVPGKRRILALGVLVLAVAIFALPMLVTYTPKTNGSATVAAIQGNVPVDGRYSIENYRQVAQNHVDTTMRLAIDVLGGTAPKPTFVVWPENTAASDPFNDNQARNIVSVATSAIKAPILVGAIVNNKQDTLYNQGIVWDPVTGAGDRYSKQHPVPFGEYMPLRGKINGNFGNLPRLTRDIVPGTSSDPITIAGVKVADAICFDIDYDDTIYKQVSRGAQMITVQSSNALFTGTKQLDQQFAVARLRAIETGRSVVVATTNGVSGIIAPDGRVISQTAPRTQAILLEKVSLSTSITPGVRMGMWIGKLCVIITVAGLLASIVLRLRKRRPADTTTDATQSKL